MSTQRHRRSPRLLPELIAVVALLALAVAGCGGGGGLTVSTVSPAQKPIKTTPISLPGGARAVWGKPAGGAAPKGPVLMLIHGGSWAGLSAPAFNQMLAISTLFQNLGFETLTVDYRHGALGVTDVEKLYRITRSRVGTRPICAVGVSAGGHLALELAVHNPDLACVISLAGPTDLPNLARDPHGAAGYQIALNAFGSSLLAPLSPALHAGSIKAKLLLIYAQNDPLVPVQQGYDMKRADPSARLIVLPPGTAPFVHTGVGASVATTSVSASAYAAAQKDEVSFLNAVGAG